MRPKGHWNCWFRLPSGSESVHEKSLIRHFPIFEREISGRIPTALFAKRRKQTFQTPFEYFPRNTSAFMA